MPSNSPVPMKPTKASLERTVRERAQDSGNVIVKRHAFQRIGERSISFGEMLNILQTGHVYEDPVLSPFNEWVVEIEKRMPGGRDAAVVTAVHTQGKLIVITVMWKDLT